MFILAADNFFLPLTPTNNCLLHGYKSQLSLPRAGLASPGCGFRILGFANLWLYRVSSSSEYVPLNSEFVFLESHLKVNKRYPTWAGKFLFFFLTLALVCNNSSKVSSTTIHGSSTSYLRSYKQLLIYLFTYLLHSTLSCDKLFTTDFWNQSTTTFIHNFQSLLNLIPFCYF